MDLKMHRTLVSVFAVLAALATIVAAVSLFQQTQPAIPSSQMAANCDPTLATPASVNTGSDGEITFSCSPTSPTTSPAFTTSATVEVRPSITGLVAPYGNLYIYDADGTTNTGNCGLRTGANLITTGGGETIPAGGWNYCALYSDVGLTGLPEFTVEWTT